MIEYESLSEKEQCVVLSLEGHHWLRPMDLGGYDGGHHSATLRSLVKKGVVERRRRFTLMNSLGSGRGSYVYRLADDFAEHMKSRRKAHSD